MRLFSYKITDDTGFAPNPFGSTLTLATCKPLIRQSKDVGDWVAGFTSKALNGDPVGDERLLFLMRVGEKLRIRDYFHDSRFQDKIPDVNGKGPYPKTGDNIYRPIAPGACEPEHFEQLKNPNHWTDSGPDLGHRKTDIGGQYVLVADEFYYFGKDSVNLPAEVRPKVPTGPSGHGWHTEATHAKSFIEYMRSRFTPGRHGLPHYWKDEENTPERSSCGGC